MKWQDIDLKRKTIIVCRTVQRIKSCDKKKTELLIGDTKTQSSHRMIPICIHKVWMIFKKTNFFRVGFYFRMDRICYSTTSTRKWLILFIWLCECIIYFFYKLMYV